MVTPPASDARLRRPGSLALTGGRGVRARMRRATSRGMTLIELLVVVALVALLSGGIVVGMGSVTNAKMKGAATLITAAIRSARTRASAVAKPMRVVLDIDGSRVWLEEGSRPMLVSDQAPAGGADAATETERRASEEAQKLLKGPAIPKPAFKAVKQAGFEPDESGKPGRELGGRTRFREINVIHQTEALREGRAYLYVWPGGQTEQAYIQLAKSADTTSDSDVLTLTVHPITGKVKLWPGIKTLPFGIPGAEVHEREDSGG